MVEGVQRALMSKDSVKVIIEEGAKNAWTESEHSKILDKLKAYPLSYCRVYGIIDSVLLFMYTCQGKFFTLASAKMQCQDVQIFGHLLCK
jgi:hypothetical protein